MKLVIIRTAQNEKQTIGIAFLIDESGQKLNTFTTLELPNLANAKRISCIPKGDYNIEKRHSEKFGYHFLVNNVPNRDFILIHQGNYYTQTKGCILLGLEHAYINSDDLLDVKFSIPAMKALLIIAPKTLNLKIIELW